MGSDRDLLAQWAGEELFAADRDAAAAAALHRARGAFYLAMLRTETDAPPTMSEALLALLLAGGSVGELGKVQGVEEQAPRPLDDGDQRGPA